MIPAWWAPRLRTALLGVVAAGTVMACSSGPDTAPSSALSGAARERAPVASSSKVAASVAVAQASSSGLAVESASPAVAPRAKGHHGVFVWEIGKNGPSAERAAQLAAEWGVGRVFIKSSEGAGGVRVTPTDAGAPSSSASSGGDAVPTKTPPRNRWAQNFSAENVRAFLDRGMEVWAFGYFYPDAFVDKDGIAWGSLDAQVTASVATLHPGVTGLVVDAEAEFDGKEADATRLCRLLRERLGDKRLAYSSFGWLSAQRRFPFKAFDKGCGDAFLPQVYYDFGWPGGVSGSLERMRKDIATLGLRAPVWPVQSNERNATVADMSRFFDEAGADSSIFYLHMPEAEQTRRMGAIRW